MKRVSTLLLGGLGAFTLAACNAPKNDTTTGGTGSETGSMSGTASATDAAAPGAAPTGAPTDSTPVAKDTTVR